MKDEGFSSDSWNHILGEAEGGQGEWKLWKAGQGTKIEGPNVIMEKIIKQNMFISERRVYDTISRK